MDDDELDQLLGVVPTPRDNRRNRRAAKRAEREREEELAKRQSELTNTPPEDSSSSVETKVDYRPAVFDKAEEPIVVEKDFAPVSANSLTETPNSWEGRPPITSHREFPARAVSNDSGRDGETLSSANIGRDVTGHSTYIDSTLSSHPLVSNKIPYLSRDDLAHRMLQSMLQSLSINHPSSLPPSTVEPASPPQHTSPGQDTTEVKQEVKSSTTNDGSHVDETSIMDVKPPKDYYVVAVKTRLPGSRRRRVGYKVIRLSNEGYTADVEEGMETDASMLEPEPQIEPFNEPPTPAQRLIQSTFSHDTISMIEGMAQIDNTHGYQLPALFHDLFATLSDHSKTVEIANHLRHQLDLPPLSTRTKSLALHRTIAKMRLELYTELVSALVLPLAPLPLPCTDDEDESEKREKITLTPSSLKYLAGVLPDAYPREKYSIKRFLADPDAPYGERKGKVEWAAGIGYMVGGDPMGPGFRGNVTNDSLVCVFVDYSNVLFGLIKHLDKKPKPTNTPTRILPRRNEQVLSLPILSLLLRRGRCTPHGSLHLVASSPLFQNLDPLVRLGWEVSVLKRVEVLENEVISSHAGKPFSSPNPKSYHQRDSLVPPGNVPAPKKFKEQGVDEILHLKILQMLNTRPTPAPEGSTIVLATGDAKGGQFNRDGFPGAVREAIKRGWTVELWSFSDGLSSTWKEVKRKEKWDTKFTVRTFDQWADYMVEVGEPHP